MAMGDTNTKKGIMIVNIEDKDSIKVLRALASERRIKILSLLRDKRLNVSEIAKKLGMPQSTIAIDIEILKEKGLLTVETIPGERGLQKICSSQYDEVVIQLPSMKKEIIENIIRVEMPVGLYTDFKVSPPCGLCSKDEIIGFLDVPTSFFNPKRAVADLVWFERGYIEYKFPNNLPTSKRLKRLEISMEISSEVPGTNKEWPSDITLWINGIEIGTYTVPGDFGDRRGKLTPSWWKLAGSQYGILKRWIVTNEGTFIDEVKGSDVTLEDLKIREHTSIRVRVGIKPEAINVGGLNIFGKSFGDYEQDIVMVMELE
jgi:predicted transcriptional regulator